VSALVPYWLHLRPRSWGIVFAHYLCGSLVVIPHARGENIFQTLGGTLAGGLLWTICLNGGTLALNSAFDRDEGDIGYLDNPPPPPRFLALFSLVLLCGGAVLAALWMPASFSRLYWVCLVLSILYSVPPVRLKAVGGADLVVNMAGYGAATFAAGGLATGLLPQLPSFVPARLYLGALGFAFLFGAFYPMTQIYQIPEDRARGDRTLAIMLGVKGSLVFAIVFEVLALLAHLAGTQVGSAAGLHSLAAGAVVAIGGIAWLIFTADWLRRWETYPGKRGMYRALWLWAVSDVLIVLAYGFLLRTS